MKNEIIELLEGQISILKDLKNPYDVPCQITFSKDDVCSILSNLVAVIEVMEEKLVSSNLDEIKEKVMDNIISVIESHEYDENISLDLNYDRTIDSSFDTSKLSREVKNELDDIFTTLEEEMETENVMSE